MVLYHRSGFFYMGLRNSLVFAPLFRFCITVPFLYHCSFFSQGTTEQKRNSVVLYQCSVFLLTVFLLYPRPSVISRFLGPFLSSFIELVCNTVPFFHRFATDIMEYESRKLLCHPKDIVSSLRDRVLKEMEGEEVIDIPKSEDADNSRVLRAKLLASSDSIAFSAKLSVFVIADQTAIYTVRLYPTESCTCPIKKNCVHILGVKIGQGMSTTLNVLD